jgi:hypothetical protein
MEIKKLREIPYGNAFVEIDEENNCYYYGHIEHLLQK